MRFLYRIVLVVALVVLAFFGWFFFINIRYAVDPARTKALEDRIKKLEGGPYVQASLESHKWQCTISTSANVTNRFPPRILGPGTNRFNLSQGWKIASGNIFVCAWITQWSPRSDITKLDDLYIQPSQDGGCLELVVVPREGENINMTIFGQYISKRDLRQVSHGAPAP